jgi:uncharacterized protein (TIGR02266 family)
VTAEGGPDGGDHDGRRDSGHRPHASGDQTTPGADQRRHERVPINREFDVISEYISEYVTDISRGGVFVRSKNPLSVGTTVNLHFSVIVRDFQTIEGQGEVVRVDMSDDNAGMGIAFTKLTADSKRLIDRIIQLHRHGEL